MLLPSCPSKETRRTSFRWARLSAAKALPGSGVRRDRCDKRALIFRRIGCERGGFVVPADWSSDEWDTLAR
jgi:hypothetical protein